MIKSIFPVLFLLLFSNFLFGQVDSIAPYSRGNITFNVQNGITHGKAEMHSGELRPDPRTGHVFHGNLNYTYNFSRKFGATVGVGLGAFPLIYEMYQLDLGRSMYFDAVDYNRFASFRSELNFKHNLTQNYLLNGFGGISMYTLSPAGISRSASSYNQPNYLYGMRFKYENGWKPVAHIGTGISRVLPNKDLLTFRIDYNYSFQDFYSGTYQIMPGTAEFSEGLYYNNGNHLNLGLGYTFSRQEKAERMARNKYEGFDKEDRKKYRAAKRLIPVNSTMIGFSGGITAPINKADDKNGWLLNSSLPMLMPSVFLEHNLENNFYAEGNFGFQEYYETRKIAGQPWTSGTNAFYGFHFNAGGGKRLIGKRNNYNYLNISAGVGVTLIDREKGHDGSSGLRIISPPDTLFSLKSEDYVLRRYSPNLYIGASKDFRLANNFYFTMLYRYNQGLLRLYEQRAEYTSHTTSGPQKATISMNGSYHTFQLGFKFNIGNLPEKSEKRDFIPFEKGTFIVSAMPSMMWYQNKVDKKSDVSESSYKYTMEAFAPAVGVEYYIDGKNYLEGRANYQKLYHWDVGMDIVNLSIGAGRRISLPSGVELFNLQGGVSLGAVTGVSGINSYKESHNSQNQLIISSRTFDERTRSGEYNLFVIEGNDTSYSRWNKHQVTSRFIPALYLGISKDFRLSDKLSIGVSAFRHLGLNTFYVIEEKYRGNYAGESKESMNGSGTQVFLNLKYRLR